MSDYFDRVLAPHITAVEGGYVNDPRDSGGETNHGITATVARRNGYHGKMRELTKAVALQIYKNEYFVRPGYHLIATISEPVAEELFDSGVNAGPGRASTWLQEALNALNNQGKLYADIAEDGRAGQGTRSALTAYLKSRGSEGEKVLLKALNVLQGAFYIDLSRRRPKDEAFVYGWLRTRVSL